MMHNLIYQQSDSFYEQYLHSASDSLGSFCSGGTIANITALWVARNQLLCADGKFPGVAKAGLAAAYRHYGFDNIGIMSSSRGHYSLAKTVDVLGIGRDNMLTTHSASQRLEPEQALALGKSYQDNGNKLLAIVGIAGTTETGHVDPLDELADVAKELGCWFHVDAAWGGATLFSQQYRHKLSGIEKADSVTIDAHKQMYVPMGAGMAIFKDPKHSNAVRHHAQYILREGSKDLGATTLEGSRNGMAMMVYSSLHILGRRGYELLINKSIEFAKEFAQMINEHSEFELVTSPVLSLLTYRLRPSNLSNLNSIPAQDYEKINKQLDAITVSVQKQQREAGKSFVSRTRIEVEPYSGNAITVFRVVLANPLTTREHLSAILNEQLSIANRMKSYKNLQAIELADFEQSAASLLSTVAS
jgi:glutamate decarboxylase